MVTGTRGKKALHTATGRDDLANFVDDHDYTLLGVAERNGEKYVRLRNPWGDTRPDVDESPVKTDVDDGTFELSLANYRKYFGDLMVSKA